MTKRGSSIDTRAKSEYPLDGTVIGDLVTCFTVMFFGSRVAHGSTAGGVTAALITSRFGGDP